MNDEVNPKADGRSMASREARVTRKETEKNSRKGAKVKTMRD
jgi:hypothetical protein